MTKRKKKQTNKSDSDSSSDSSESENDKKSKGKKKQKKESSDSESEEDKKPVKNSKNTKDSKNSKKSQKDKDSESSSESSIDANATEKSDTESSEEEVVKKPVKKSVRFEEPSPKGKDTNGRPVKKSQKIVNKTLIVESDKIEDDPDNYNDYMVDFSSEFGGDLNNISDIKIVDMKIPLSPEIDDSCNMFTITYNGEGYELELEGGKYTIEEILQDFNESLESVECGITVSLKNNGKIVLEQENDENFEISCGENSIGKYLGFTKDKYTNKSKYVSDEANTFASNPIYMYIKNISKDKPFALIHPSGKFEQQILSFDPPISKLSCLIIQFKSEISKGDDNLVNFNRKPHTITFTFKVTE